MSDYLALGVLCCVGAYALAGIIYLMFARLPVSATFLVKTTLLPGMVIFWPLAWWCSPASTAPKDGATQHPATPAHRWLRQLQGLAILSLAVLAPLTLLYPIQTAFAPARNHNAPYSILLEQPWIQKGGIYGSILLSIPGKVYLGRDTARRQGLLIRFNEGATYPPTALYWSGNLDNNDGFPADATYLGMISGPEDCWIEITAREMRNSGQWIVYSPFFRSFDSYTFSSDRESH